MRTASTRGAAPAPTEIVTAARAIYDQLGARGAATALGVSAAALARVCGGLPVARGTVSLLRSALSERGDLS